jgi:hypothetical protein
VETEIPPYKQHLLCDEHGLYRAELNDSERRVVAAESKRSEFKFWYRNPDRPSQDSLGIAYTDGDVTKIARPDFVFFVEEGDKVAADIVDPHGTHLADALPKLKGLARYIETHPGVFRRFEAIAEVDGRLRKLDLTRADVRQAIMAATSAEPLYKSAVAGDYP